MPIAIKRAYDKATTADGHRVLVDRLWPRGLSKDDLELDEWLREAAPSDELRQSFHNGEVGWQQFRNQYLGELKEHREELRRLAELARDSRLTLVFAAKDTEHNNAVVLKQYLQMLTTG